MYPISSCHRWGYTPSSKNIDMLAIGTHLMRLRTPSSIVNGAIGWYLCRPIFVLMHVQWTFFLFSLRTLSFAFFPSPNYVWPTINKKLFPQNRSYEKINKFCDDKNVAVVLCLVVLVAIFFESTYSDSHHTYTQAIYDSTDCTYFIFFALTNSFCRKYYHSCLLLAGNCLLAISLQLSRNEFNFVYCILISSKKEICHFFLWIYFVWKS